MELEVIKINGRDLLVIWVTAYVTEENLGLLQKHVSSYFKKIGGYGKVGVLVMVDPNRANRQAKGDSNNE